MQILRKFNISTPTLLLSLLYTLLLFIFNQKLKIWREKNVIQNTNTGIRGSISAFLRFDSSFWGNFQNSSPSLDCRWFSHKYGFELHSLFLYFFSFIGFELVFESKWWFFYFLSKLPLRIDMLGRGGGRNNSEKISSYAYIKKNLEANIKKS